MMAHGNLEILNKFNDNNCTIRSEFYKLLEIVLTASNRNN